MQINVSQGPRAWIILTLYWKCPTLLQSVATNLQNNYLTNWEGFNQYSIRETKRLQHVCNQHIIPHLKHRCVEKMKPCSLQLQNCEAELGVPRVIRQLQERWLRADVRAFRGRRVGGWRTGRKKKEAKGTGCLRPRGFGTHDLMFSWRG